MKISVAMIVKNEEVLLERALTSLNGVDEIIICDTGSEDNTIAIAKKFTDKVFTDYKWNDSFAEARNHSLDKCTGDWILIIDADEYLAEGAITLIREKIKSVRGKCINFKCKGEKGSGYHFMPRLFKTGLGIKYKGVAHNYLTATADESWDDLILYYGYSPAHEKDPDRTLRILLKAVKANPELLREKFYLAREYLYRKDYISAIYWYEEYINKSVFLSERSEAYYQLGRCYWNINKGDKARLNVLHALEINANFKDALIFMAEMSWPQNAKVWRKFAEFADNSNVLFVRNE